MQRQGTYVNMFNNAHGIELYSSFETTTDVVIIHIIMYHVYVGTDIVYSALTDKIFTFNLTLSKFYKSLTIF